MKQQRPRNRRSSVSGECATPVFPAGTSALKVPEIEIGISASAARALDANQLGHLEKLQSALATHFLFGGLSTPEWILMWRSMRLISVAANQMVINQGDDGASLYIVKVGRFQVIKDSLPLDTVYSRLGDIFGELALLYNAPRAASVKSLSEGELWMLDRALFTKLLRDSRLQKRAKMIDVISRISPSLTQVESSLLADVMEEKLFLAGDKISFGFFIVVSGDVLLNGAHILHSDSFHLDASLRDDGLALSPQVTILFLNGPDVTRLYDELMVVVQARPSSSCSSLKTMSSLKAVSSENTLVNSYLQDSFKPTSSSFKWPITNL